jgi:hydroxylamine reductase
LDQAKEEYLKACKKANAKPEIVDNGDWKFKPGIEALAREGREYDIDKNKGDWNNTCVKELAQYGIKGGLAYLHHAMRLGYENSNIYAESARLLSNFRKSMKLDEALKLALDVGKWNLSVMELLDKANTESYGKPEITAMRTTPVKGKCILVSEHDLDLVLKQTEGKNINGYTHGEMLPCCAYPG